ncbi:hypothetical protein LOZ39_004691 [Ophidiomyces ophidiicola]|nr:hypothetical protein LOZ61_003704 [Ophidiomyces ophidiicola]KAI1913356.1 hypothetical protein LOZ64_004136 [Ophidiomyces ophidiicola]KAI1927381.1 hypothetical protein LOZ60_003155 [Ophidiomyces ophidiicola]KAI1953644.1 hypothetical protein LOZ59_004994 [Ophidiomyces ophidiicola]KAI2013381.1 hypothetical protein LOZ49_002161 [Ophidiomyces ophidiicola]
MSDAEVEVKKKRGRPKKVESSASTAKATPAKKPAKSSKKAPAEPKATARAQTGNNRAAEALKVKESRPKAALLKQGEKGASAELKTNEKDSTTTSRKPRTVKLVKAEKAKQASQLESIGHQEQPAEALTAAVSSQASQQKSAISKADEIASTEPERTQTGPKSPAPTAIQQSTILSALRATTGSSSIPPPPPPPPAIPAVTAMPPPKTPVSNLASSISKSRKILPDPTNSGFKVGPATGKQAVVRNLDEITRIGAQRSMPSQPRAQYPPAAEDIRKTKKYKALSRRWLAGMVAMPILICTSWALYERVFYDKTPRSLPGANAFPPSGSSNESFNSSASTESSINSSTT